MRHDHVQDMRRQTGTWHGQWDMTVYKIWDVRQEHDTDNETWLGTRYETSDRNMTRTMRRDCVQDMRRQTGTWHGQWDMTGYKIWDVRQEHDTGNETWLCTRYETSDRNMTRTMRHDGVQDMRCQTKTWHGQWDMTVYKIWDIRQKHDTDNETWLCTRYETSDRNMTWTMRHDCVQDMRRQTGTWHEQWDMTVYKIWDVRQEHDMDNETWLCVQVSDGQWITHQVHRCIRWGRRRLNLTGRWAWMQVPSTHWCEGCSTAPGQCRHPPPTLHPLTTHSTLHTWSTSPLLQHHTPWQHTLHYIPGLHHPSSNTQYTTHLVYITPPPTHSTLHSWSTSPLLQHHTPWQHIAHYTPSLHHLSSNTAPPDNSTLEY